MIVNLIFPNQLFRDLSVLEKNIAFLVEDCEFFTKFNFHKNKLVLHRATMKFYENYLIENGFDVEYINFSENWAEILMKNDVSEIVTYELNNFELEERIKNLNIKIKFKKSPMFLSSNDEFETLFSSKKHYSQTSFYMYMRKANNILVDKKFKPYGGKWTYDKENREKIPNDLKIPDLPILVENFYVKEAKKYVELNFPKNVGTVDFFNYPTTYDELDFWLSDFISNRLPDFGRYQDAILEKDSCLFHSNMSFALNIGLITPKDLVQKIVDADIPMNSKEGYVRQIIGWREFVKGVYSSIGKTQMESNFWGFQNKLTQKFYTGETGILPVDNVIKKLLKTAYVNHIERLMVLGNFFLLCEITPSEVYRWFMEMSIDSYPWVMCANVFGMSQFSDGGMIVTKPYFSSSNYIKKMSNFEEGAWCRIFDGLFWRFVYKHKDFFTLNPRLRVLVSNLNRKSDYEIRQLIKVADDFLQTVQ